jgi:hypothetical protein
MRKIPIFILLLLFLSSCNLPRKPPGLILGLIPTDTPTTESGYVQCAWAWATQALPEVSAEVQAAMQAAGVKGITARAEAFGENCINAAGEVDSFATMETDFRISVEVPNLSDTDRLGSLLEQILTVLDGFPTGTTPGSQPGYIGITFDTGSETLNLWFTVTDGESARALGLHQAALLEKLQNK